MCDTKTNFGIRIALSALFLLFFTFGFSQTNLKEVVAIVRPVYPDATLSFLEDFSQSLKRDGYKQASAYIDAYAKGGFGSGFVISNKGRYYILTNKHVVQSSDYVTIEFVNKRDTLKYEKCTVEAISDQKDLALVALPPEAKLKQALNLSDKELFDGNDVFTAGYPGLGGTPLWQFGKGIISNSEVYMSDSLTCVQHTAQIDAGSSGGPLLIKNKNNTFEVVGMNTWSAISRENTNYSITTKDIKLFLKKHLSDNNKFTVEPLNKRVNELISHIEKGDYKAALPFVSYSYIENIDVKDFYDLINVAPDKAKKDIELMFKKGLPLEALRIALSSAICTDLRTRNVEVLPIEKNLKEKKEASVHLKSKKKTIISTWKLEQNKWRISQLSSMNINNLKKSGIVTNSYFKRGLVLSVELADDVNVGNINSLSYFFTFSSFVLGGWSLGLASFNLPAEGSFSEKRKSKGGYVDYLLGLQLPYRIKSIMFIPNVKGFVGVALAEDSPGFIYGYSFGMQVAYQFNRKNNLLIGFDIKARTDKSISESIKYNDTVLGLNIGITF